MDKKNSLLLVLLLMSFFVNSQDKDKDGVLDIYDECPEVSGVASQKGCPNIAYKKSPIICGVEKILVEFKQAIYFDKPEFKKFALNKLDTIVLIMKEYPKSSFNIEGFMGNKETSKKDRLLSTKRAERVFDYIIAKGIDINRLSLVVGKEDDISAINKICKGSSISKCVAISLNNKK